MNKRSRKLIIADAIGIDSDDLESYQPGRHRPPLFTAGDYFTAIKPGEKLPAEHDWHQVELWRKDDVESGWQVYRSE